MARTKSSTIFFWIAGILTLIFLISLFGLTQQASVTVGEGPVSVTVAGISETAAIILFVLILISLAIGGYFKSKRK